MLLRTPGSKRRDQPVAAMAVMFTFKDRALLDQRPERPALQRAVRGAGGMHGQLALRKSMAALESLDPASIASRSSSLAVRAELYPLFGVNTRPLLFKLALSQSQQGSAGHPVDGEADPEVQTQSPPGQHRVVNAIRKMQESMLAHFLVAWPATKKETKKT
jgi:hypothetical protein